MTFSCSLKVKILLNYYGIYYVMFFCQLHIFAKLFIIDIISKFCLCKYMFAPKRITLILKPLLNVNVLHCLLNDIE